MTKSSKKKRAKSVKPTPHFMEIWRDSRVKRLRGACYILLALFLTLSIISFFCTGQNEDKELWKENWMGYLGGALAPLLTKHLFGIASLGLTFLLALHGLRIWNVEPLPRRKTVWCTLFWVVWLSTALGYVGGKVENTAFDNYAGMGLVFAEYLYNLIRWGTVVCLIFVAVVFLIFVHRVKMQMPKIELPKIDIPLPKRGPNTILADNTKEKNRGKKLNHIVDLVPDETETPSPKEPQMLNPKDDEGMEFNEDGELDVASFLGLDKDPTPTPSQATKDDGGTTHFDIDDEFGRVMQKAQGKKGETTEVEFTINDTGTGTADTDKEPTIAELNPTEEPTTPEHHGIDEPYDPHLDLKDYKMPSTEGLHDWEESNVKVTKEELIENKDRIVRTLHDYGIEITEISASPGPTVTLYEIKPAPGVRISKIKSLEDDIALSLSAMGIRIIAPIPGKGTVGIEVPNTKPQIVSMKTMLNSDAFKNSGKMQLPIALGKTISNEPYVTDLAKMPHLLMAGATGTGKSVGLNAVIASLLYKKHPSELKFVMVDPKKVELSLYSKIERHYLAKLPDSDEAIITDVKKVVCTLNSLCIEMDQRYDLLKQAQVRKITEYNDKFIHRQLNPEHGHHYLPYIVLVIDEFADLIMTAGKEVETPICRLAQLARAVGIHLIIATQRPTTNIITGTIKANFPARIAFKVTSGIDSRTILDTSGAQRLIGRGDMLISLSGSDLVRLQCALIETDEIDQLADSIGQQRGYPEGFLLPEYLDENAEPNKEFDPKQKDEFFNDAARMVVTSQFGSTSLLQRKLQLGYNRAGRIIDQLEAAGIVGPYNGSKAREVLVKDENTLEEILRNL